jgi:hypothetical protein
MAGNVVGTSAELTSDLTKMAFRSGGHFARDLGEKAIQRMWPGVYIPPKVRIQQGILRRFEGKLAMAGDLIDPNGGLEDDELEARASSTARALVDIGLVSDSTVALELRPVLPKDAVDDPVLNDRRKKAVRLLEHTFAHDYDITSIPFPSPITPSEHRDSPIDIAAAWGAISADLSDLSRQLRVGRANPRVAMLAITGTPYSNAFFEAQPGRSEYLDHYGLVVLQRVGTLPEDNMLVPVSRARTSEDPDGPGPIWTP